MPVVKDSLEALSEKVEELEKELQKIKGELGKKGFLKMNKFSEKKVISLRGALKELGEVTEEEIEEAKKLWRGKLKEKY